MARKMDEAPKAMDGTEAYLFAVLKAVRDGKVTPEEASALIAHRLKQADTNHVSGNARDPDA